MEQKQSEQNRMLGFVRFVSVGDWRSQVS